MKYQKPSLEILIVMSEDVITASSPIQDKPAGGGKEEGGSYDDLFGTKGASVW